MTDNIKTFTCDQTGEKYKFTTKTCDDRPSYKGSIIITPIIEPKLEVGDWWQDDDGGLHCIKDIDIDSPISDRVCHQVRKANGEVWKKENDEWKQKK